MDQTHGENKRFHLQMIQGVVNRLAQNSFQIKGWSVVLVAALFALAANNENPPIAVVALFPAFSLWLLDAYFLWQERLFRALYVDVSEKSEAAIDFSMDAASFKGREDSWSRAAFWPKPPRNTLFIFHGTIVVAILAVSTILIYLESYAE